MVKGRRLFWTWNEAQAKTQDEVDAWLRPYVPAGMKRLSEWVILNFDLFRVSLRKQSTFRDATTGTHWFPREMTSEKRVRNSILGTCHYPVLGSATDWLKKIFHAARPTTSTTQMWVVTRHQYGISALVSQTSFRGETSGSVAKCRLFPQASFARLSLLNQLRSTERTNKHRFSHRFLLCLVLFFLFCFCFQAVFETTLTRVLLPLPVLVIPPFVMQLLER